MQGALAQLGAHNTGSVGVTGSSPVRSTKNKGLQFFCKPFVLVKSIYHTVKCACSHILGVLKYFHVLNKM